MLRILGVSEDICFRRIRGFYANVILKKLHRRSQRAMRAYEMIWDLSGDSLLYPPHSMWW